MRRGLTLLETLVSLGISSIVFLIVSSLLVTFYTSDARSKQVEVFERTKNDIALILSNSVRWSTTVTTELDALSVDGSTFSLRDGRLYKNEDPLSSQDIRITRFEIQDYSDIALHPSLQIEVEMEDVNNALRTDTLRVVVSRRLTSSQTGGP